MADALSDLELEDIYEAGAALCPPLENNTHLYGLRAVQARLLDRVPAGATMTVHCPDCEYTTEAPLVARFYTLIGQRRVTADFSYADIELHYMTEHDSKASTE